MISSQYTIQFSASAIPKHIAGIQPAGACSGYNGKPIPYFSRETNCRVFDKGIQNDYGVWFIPAKGSKEQPPSHFWNLKEAPRV